LNLLTINRKLPVINLVGISLGWSQLNLRLALVDGNMLKSIDFLGQDSMLVILGAVRSDQVITLINLVAVGLLVKSLDISLSNNTLGVVGFSIKSFVGVLNWVLSSNKWKNILHGCRNTDVSEDNIVLWRLDLEGDGIQSLVKVEPNLDLILLDGWLSNLIKVLEEDSLGSSVEGLSPLIDRRWEFLAGGDGELSLVNSF